MPSKIHIYAAKYGRPRGENKKPKILTLLVSKCQKRSVV